MDWTPAPRTYTTSAANIQPLGSGPAALLEQSRAKPAGSGRWHVGAEDVRIVKKYWKTPSNRKQNERDVYDVQNDPKRDPTIKPQPPKMIKIVRNCDLCLEKLEAFGFLFHICTCSLPGKISRRRTPQNLDHFGLLPGRPGSHHVPPIASEVSQKLVSQATAAGWPGAKFYHCFR